MKDGSCKIPDCTCKQYQDKIKKIDEDLLYIVKSYTKIIQV